MICKIPKGHAIKPRAVPQKKVSKKAQRLSDRAFTLFREACTVQFYGQHSQSHKEFLEQTTMNAQVRLLNYIGELEAKIGPSWSAIAKEQLRNPIRATTKERA